ncbi:hypothetical protein QJS10_CPB21g01492 [Acorus calamus]|uniref:Wound-induced protein 1 n=1 Tax=Acorus calamus TaxID=4465 RepID=A0AAV9C6P7_ACOCL|nr:hypothetical protein QJS10_CPB21g01492 [Acorus calamus]
MEGQSSSTTPIERLVEALYDGLRRGDTEAVSGLIAPDLEWWFHGPPGQQHMMMVLTGQAGHKDFRFDPRRVARVGRTRVVAEGWAGSHAYWVHVWTVANGLITQFREYFNTWLTVRDLRRTWEEAEANEGGTIWESEVGVHPGRSLPGLVLAI